MRIYRQYFRYGRGRAYTTLKHRRLTSWRQAAPVVLLVGLGGAVVLGFWQPWFWAVPVFYAGTLILVALCSLTRGGKGRRIGLKQRLMVAAAWAVMHMAWGLGFVWETIMRLIPIRDCG